MYQRRTRKFRRHPNGRNHSSRDNDGKMRFRPNLFISNKPRNNFRLGQNPEKLFEKYSELAKEARSSGDKTLCENYMQHADHFMRLMTSKNKLQSSNVDQNSNKISLEEKNQEKNSNSDLKDSTKNSDLKDSTKNSDLKDDAKQNK